jgi:hypothetical protein
MRTPLLAAFALLLFAGPGFVRAAGDCDSNGQPALGIVQVTAGTAETTVYVDDRNYLENGIWMYVESNGVWTQKDAGVYFGDPDHVDLQRGGYSCVVPDCLGGNEICVDDSWAGPDLEVL